MISTWQQLVSFTNALTLLEFWFTITHSLLPDTIRYPLFLKGVKTLNYKCTSVTVHKSLLTEAESLAL